MWTLKGWVKSVHNREVFTVVKLRLDGSTLFTFGTYTLTTTVPAHKIMVGSVCMHSSLTSGILSRISNFPVCPLNVNSLRPSSLK